MELGEPGGDTRSRSQRTALIVLIVGVLLVALGITYQAATSNNARQSTVFDQIVFGILIAVGGGVIGASINTLVVRRFEMDVLSEVREIVSRSLNACFLSEDREINRFRQLWHHYYVTQIDGNVCWWYEKYSFTRNLTIGSLSQQSTLRDSSGNAHVYLTEVGVRGNRLILFSTQQDGSESAAVEVFPMPRGFQNIHTGIAVLETWDASQILGKVILSKIPLVEDIPEGRVHGDHTEILNKTWGDSFKRTVDIALDV